MNKPLQREVVPALPIPKILNQVLHGDCVQLMAKMPSHSIDFVLTDPPFICRHQSRDGCRIINDDNAAWVKPAFAEIHRLMKPDSFCVSSYGWPRLDAFVDAWKAAGFRIAGHIVFRKHYASSVGFLKYHHEPAYLLAKGNPKRPAHPLADVIEWVYPANRLHPTQKHSKVLIPLVRAFTKVGDIVLDPFCGSGSTLVAAKLSNRTYVGIELDKEHYKTATSRLTGRQ